MNRTAETPWAAVPLLNPEKATEWFKSDVDARLWSMSQDVPYDIQYRPKKKKVKR